MRLNVLKGQPRFLVCASGSVEKCLKWTSHCLIEADLSTVKRREKLLYEQNKLGDTNWPSSRLTHFKALWRPRSFSMPRTERRPQAVLWERSSRSLHFMPSACGISVTISSLSAQYLNSPTLTYCTMSSFRFTPFTLGTQSKSPHYPFPSQPQRSNVTCPACMKRPSSQPKCSAKMP